MVGSFPRYLFESYSDHLQPTRRECSRSFDATINYIGADLFHPCTYSLALHLTTRLPVSLHLLYHPERLSHLADTFFPDVKNQVVFNQSLADIFLDARSLLASHVSSQTRLET